MRVSRWYVLLTVAVLAAMVITPAIATAVPGPGLLTNEYGQTFLGSGANTADELDGCIGCHGSSYDQTSHGQFVKVTTQTIEPSKASGMYDGLALGGEVNPDLVFTTGAGTGLREYLVFGHGVNGPFGVAVLEWDPAMPSIWEIDGTTTEIEFEDYGCNQCHQLGATKKGVKPPVTGNTTTGTANAWATFAGDDPADLATWIPGASIQCERCHGTGVAAAADAGGHWGSGVQVVGYNNTANVSSGSATGTAKVASGNILKSEVCGQCHGSFKSGGSAYNNIAGYTPDRNINAFVPRPYTLADVPTESQFLADRASFEASTTGSLAYRFFPNGQNAGDVRTNSLNGKVASGGNKHVYYTEWALSGHSVRTAYSATATDAAGLPLTTPYQQSGAAEFSPASSVLCKRCHTGEGYLKRKGAAIMDSWTEGVDASGKLGQECVVCHISHDDSVGAEGTTAHGEAVGMAVRSPEKANGSYSTLGLSVDNKSICEDCHNWQREVNNAGAAPTLPTVSADPDGGIIIGRYVSHPQREIYHGRAMLEVPEGADFMPGATCEECHMPATRSDFPAKTGLERYDDRSWKRYSHRMFIMRPGDAESWGLAPWGDSCSPCHPGETQSELEANLVSWQDDASTLADEASAAIAAALVRTGAVTSANRLAAETNLVARAAANYWSYDNDASSGAHNPPYIQAALAKSVELAKSAGGSISVAAPASVGSGALFGIQGMVMNGDGSHAAGVTVKLYKGATLLGTAVADDMGNYAFAYAQTVGSTYSVEWVRSSQSVSTLSKNVTIGMGSGVVKADTDLTLNLNPSPLKRYRTLVLTGQISPAFGGASIAIYYKRPGSSTWNYSRTITTASNGTFRTWSKPTKIGTYSYRAKFAGNASYLGSSAIATVRVYR